MWKSHCINWMWKIFEPNIVMGRKQICSWTYSLVWPQKQGKRAALLPFHCAAYFLSASTKMWKNSCKHCSSNEGSLGTNSPRDWKQGFLCQIYAGTCFFVGSQLDCRVEILSLTSNLLANNSLSPLPPPWIYLSCPLYFSRVWKILTCW